MGELLLSDEDRRELEETFEERFAAHKRELAEELEALRRQIEGPRRNGEKRPATPTPAAKHA